MKVLAFVGSPRKHGNSAQLVQAFCDGAKAAGHETEVVNVTDLDIKGCRACRACKATEDIVCSIQDDMQKLYSKIIVADCIVLASPVYMGQMTGQLKLFLDRWYPFMESPHKVRQLPGKRYVTITVGGRSAENFLPIAEYYDDRLGRILGMKCVENIIGGGLSHPIMVNSQPELIEKAHAVGKSLR